MKPRREPGKPVFDPERVDPRDLGLSLAQLPPDHDLVVAARLAVEIADQKRALREASLDVHSAHTPAEWRQWADQYVSHEQLERRRFAPTGDREEWVRWGPAGPPQVPQQRDREPALEEPPQWEAAPDAASDGVARVRGR